LTNLGFEFEAYGPDGETPNAQIAQAMRVSAHRILYTVLHSRGMDGIDPDTHILEITPWWQITLISLEIVFGVAAAGSVTLVVLDLFKKKQ
jgi:beta-glucosidase